MFAFFFSRPSPSLHSIVVIMTLTYYPLQKHEFVGGEKLSLADVLLYCFLTFGESVGQPINPENKNIMAWLDRMKARPSASA